jgi:hypothetical protein
MGLAQPCRCSPPADRADGPRSGSGIDVRAFLIDRSVAGSRGGQNSNLVMLANDVLPAARGS